MNRPNKLISIFTIALEKVTDINIEQMSWQTIIKWKYKGVDQILSISPQMKKEDVTSEFLLLDYVERKLEL